jgi:hypothetical protein
MGRTRMSCISLEYTMAEVGSVNEIERVAAGEILNYEVSKSGLGDSLSLVQDVVDLYQLFVSLIEQSKIPPKDEVVAPAYFLSGCRYQLVVGVLALLRGHVSDSFHFSRKAIELSAFAARVKKHPHLAMVWLQAWHNPGAYEKYREKFSPGKLFPDDHVLLGKLYDRYDFASKFVHPSFYSMARHVKVINESAGFHLDFDYFELHDTDPAEPAGTFLWIIDTHFGIVRVFEEVLGSILNANRDLWESRRDSVDAKILMHKNKWRSTLLGWEQDKTDQTQG